MASIDDIFNIPQNDECEGCVKLKAMLEELHDQAGDMFTIIREQSYTIRELTAQLKAFHKHFSGETGNVLKDFTKDLGNLFKKKGDKGNGEQN